LHEAAFAAFAVHLAHLQPAGHAVLALAHLAALSFLHVVPAALAFLQHSAPFEHLVFALLQAVVLAAAFEHAETLAFEQAVSASLALKHSQPVSNNTTETAISTFFILFPFVSFFYLNKPYAYKLLKKSMRR
jgi:hypothetical protein